MKKFNKGDKVKIKFNGIDPKVKGKEGIVVDYVKTRGVKDKDIFVYRIKVEEKVLEGWALDRDLELIKD